MWVWRPHAWPLGSVSFPHSAGWCALQRLLLLLPEGDRSAPLLPCGASCAAHAHDSQCCNNPTIAMLWPEPRPMWVLEVPDAGQTQMVIKDTGKRSPIFMNTVANAPSQVENCLRIGRVCPDEFRHFSTQQIDHNRRPRPPVCGIAKVTCLANRSEHQPEVT